jgi:hypothetical protein
MVYSNIISSGYSYSRINEIIYKINTVVDDVINFFIHNFYIIFVYLIHWMNVEVVVDNFVGIFIKLN